MRRRWPVRRARFRAGQSGVRCPGGPQDVQRGRLAKYQPARSGRALRIKAQSGEPVEQRADRRLRLQPGKVRARAEMRAAGERETLPSVVTAQVKMVGIGEERRITVR